MDISEDTTPLFYWNIDLDMADWAKRRLLKQERERLAEHGVPLRLSGARQFAAFGGTTPGDDDYLSDPFGAADGYCESCGEDFSGSGYYCSEDCERKERPRRFCTACEDRVDIGDTVRHHISYFPEEIVTVCRACHNKIHFSDQYPELTPPEEEIRRFYDEQHDEAAPQTSVTDQESNTNSQETTTTQQTGGWEDIFPFTPRPAQEDGIETALPVLEDDGYVILEGACGTGKTLMSLTAAIEQILDGEKERLVVITPLKQQQQQFVEDLRAINQTLDGHEVLNGLTLIGKKEVCPYSREELAGFTPGNVQGRCSDLREETRDSFTDKQPVAAQAREIVEDTYVGAENPDPDPNHWPGIEIAGSWSRFPNEELPEVNDSTVCPFYAQHYAYEKRPPFTFASAPHHVFSGDDIVQTAVDEDYCPHSAMYALIDGAQVLIANYTHLFNHGVRGLLDDFIDEDTLLIVDEAHKLEARVRTNLDRDKAFSTLQTAADDLNELLSRPPIQACAGGEAIGAELTKRDLERAQAGLTRFIDQANEAISNHLHSEHGEWGTALTDFIADSDDHHDYFEEPDALRTQLDLPEDEEFALQSLSNAKPGEPDDISKAVATDANPTEDDLTPLAALAQVADAMESAIDTHKHRLETGDGDTVLDPYDTATADTDTDGNILSTPLGKAAIQRYQQWVDEDSHYTDNPELSTLGRFMEGWDDLDTISHIRLAQIEWDWTLPDRDALEAWDTDAVDAWQSAYRARLSIMNCVPQARIQDELSDFGGGIIMSATLDPMTVFREVTGLDDLADDRPVIEARYNDPGYPEENRATFLVDADWFTSDNRGDSTHDDSTMTDTRQQYATIIEAVARTHGNILLVMPSYDEAAWATTTLEQSSLVDKDVLLDQSSTNKRTEELKQSFFTGPHKILVTSSHGTLIEGVDYDGDKLHTVLVCGLPIRGGLRAQAVKHAYNHTFDGNGFEYAMLVPAVRRARQALGRVIRSPTDIGTRILADGRYANSHTATAHSYLSPNEQSEATTLSPNQLYNSLNMFWHKHGK
ncbi:MAG: helicase C-terminal domain-containing protein [Halorientalis sp.]